MAGPERRVLRAGPAGGPGRRAVAPAPPGRPRLCAAGLRQPRRGVAPPGGARPPRRAGQRRPERRGLRAPPRDRAGLAGRGLGILLPRDLQHQLHVRAERGPGADDDRGRDRHRRSSHRPATPGLAVARPDEYRAHPAPPGRVRDPLRLRLFPRRSAVPAEGRARPSHQPAVLGRGERRLGLPSSGVDAGPVGDVIRAQFDQLYAEGEASGRGDVPPAPPLPDRTAAPPRHVRRALDAHRGSRPRLARDRRRDRRLVPRPPLRPHVAHLAGNRARARGDLPAGTWLSHHDRYAWSLAWCAPGGGPGGPAGARVALWVMLALQWFPLDMPAGPVRVTGGLDEPYPDFRNYTQRDYGLRVGVFRLMAALDRLGLRATAAVNAAVCERCPFVPRRAGAGAGSSSPTGSTWGTSTTAGSRRPRRPRSWTRRWARSQAAGTPVRGVALAGRTRNRRARSISCRARDRVRLRLGERRAALSDADRERTPLRAAVAPSWPTRS